MLFDFVEVLLNTEKIALQGIQLALFSEKVDVVLSQPLKLILRPKLRLMQSRFLPASIRFVETLLLLALFDKSIEFREKLHNF